MVLLELSIRVLELLGERTFGTGSSMQRIGNLMV